MTTLGIDWGGRRIGIAFSNRSVASPYKTLQVKSSKDALNNLAELISELKAGRIVVGIPLDAEGEDTKQSGEIKEFGKELQELVDVEIIYWNEALTSKEALRGKLEAGQGKKKRKDLDATAAAYILQSYLDSHSLR